ncbi:hypothetical protein JCM6882_009740 [Rhodosporidiobolus microsporus]
MSADAEPSFLRATAQRAGSLVLYAPRRAVDAVLPSGGRARRWVPSVLLPPSSGAAGAAAREVAAAPPRPAAPSTASTTPSSQALLLPSPLTYLTSAYLFTSLSLAFLLHRIHHLVPPRTRTSLHSQTSSSSGGVARVLSPAVQIGCRAPGLLLMLRAAVGLWVALSGAGREGGLEWLRQGGGGGLPGAAGRAAARALVWSTAWAGKGAFASFISSPASSSSADGWGAAGAAAAAGADHASLLWSTFLAIASSLVCETFTRALSDDLPSVHHFNLLSFSFLLHVHSAPPLSGSGAGAGGRESASPTSLLGANRDLYTYLLLTLLELTTLQLSYCLPFLPSFRRHPTHPPPRRRTTSTPRPHRLAITALFSLLSQYFALRSWVRLFSPPAPSSGGSAGGDEASAAARHAGDAVVSIWLNKAPEVGLEVVVGVSLGLKALAALIRGEELSRENIVGHPALAPSREEDYGVALIKYATHLLSSTRLSGLALELSPLEVLPLSLSTPLTSLGLLDPPLTAEELDRMRKEEERIMADEAAAGGGGGGTGVVLRANGEVWFDEPVPLDELEGLRRRGGLAASSSEVDSPPGPHGPGCTCGAEQHPLPPDGFAHEIRRVTIEDRHNPLSSSSPYSSSSPSGGGSDAFLFDPSTHAHAYAPGGASMVHLEGQRKGALWRLLKLVGRIGVYVVWWVVSGVRAAAGRAWGRWWRGEVDVSGWRAGGGGRERGRGRTPALGGEEGGEEEDDDGGEYVPRGEEEGEDEEGWSSSEEDESEELHPQNESDEDELALLSPPPRSPLRQRRMRSPFSPFSPSAPTDADDLSNPLALYSDLSHPPSSPYTSSARPALPHRTTSTSTSTDLVLSSTPTSGATLTPEDLAPYLLAHHLRPASAGPLTRRRYSALLPSASSSSHQHSHPHSHPHPYADNASDEAYQAAAEASTSSAMVQRRRSVLSSFSSASSAGGGGDVREAMEKRREEWREGRSRFCVVCTVEERSVVLWPCRCLCLCEPCRAALADRTTTSSASSTGGAPGAEGASGGAICPTCRTPVQAFSRIYIP